MTALVDYTVCWNLKMSSVVRGWVVIILYMGVSGA